jgi:predicted TIM-barrel fold metal-dependent hydrolase
MRASRVAAAITLQSAARGAAARTALRLLSGQRARLDVLRAALQAGGPDCSAVREAMEAARAAGVLIVTLTPSPTRIIACTVHAALPGGMQS